MYPGTHKLPCPLDSFGAKVWSQNNEDGIIDEIVRHIPMTKYFVEFGVDPHEGNCVTLHKTGWPGLFMDAQKNAPWIKQEWVSASNIMDLLAKYQVPKDFGLLSIDIDGQDYFVWQQIKDTYRPPLVVIEYNGKLPKDSGFVVPRDDNFVISNHFYGASLLAMSNLAVAKGYHLVYANGVNAFYVLMSKLGNSEDFRYDDIFRWEPGYPK